MRRPSPDLLALRDEVWRELHEGRDIFDAYLQDEAGKERIYGLTESDRKVYVNTAPHVLDTVIHELLHRLRPKWGEKRIIVAAARIVASMDDAQVKQWHRRYQKVAKRKGTVVT